MIPTNDDGVPRPLDGRELAPGDWACALWHGWPASAFPDASNTHAGAPRCPVCAYPLWRVASVGSDGYMYFAGREGNENER